MMLFVTSLTKTTQVGVGLCYKTCLKPKTQQGHYFVKQDAYNVHRERTSFLKVAKEVVHEKTIVHIMLNALHVTYEGFI